jgi:hypothetical protein
MRKVVSAQCRAGQTLLANFHVRWWELQLECGHVVERNVKWKPDPNAPRGWSALHNPPKMSRLPDAPKRARCDFCL